MSATKIDPLKRNMRTYTKFEIWGLREKLADAIDEETDRLLQMTFEKRRSHMEVGLWPRLRAADEMLRMLYDQVLIHDGDRIYLPNDVTVALFDADIRL